MRIYAFKILRIYKTTVWSEVFWYALEEYTQLFENKVFRKIFGPMKHELNNL